jgi:hypothetical protein
LAFEDEQARLKVPEGFAQENPSLELEFEVEQARLKARDGIEV